MLKRSRWWLRKRNAARCYYCRVSLDPAEVTMDHVVALNLGGRSTKDNIVTCCLRCNRHKRDGNIVDFLLSPH